MWASLLDSPFMQQGRIWKRLNAEGFQSPSPSDMLGINLPVGSIGGITAVGNTMYGYSNGTEIKLFKMDTATQNIEFLDKRFDNVILYIVAHGTDVYIGGEFTTPFNKICKLNTLTGQLSGLSTGITGGWLAAILPMGPSVYVGGNEISIVRTPTAEEANGIAQWDIPAQSWNRIVSNGAVGVNGSVYTIKNIDSNIYVGGAFTTAGGVTVNRIATWNGSSWGALGSGIDGTAVYDICKYGSGIVAAGRFTDAGGVPANNIALWNGTSWSALGNGLPGGYINSLHVVGEDLYAGGGFNEGSPSNYIAKWDGTSWVPLVYPGLGAVNIITSVNDVLYVAHNNGLYVAPLPVVVGAPAGAPSEGSFAPAPVPVGEPVGEPVGAPVQAPAPVSAPVQAPAPVSAPVGAPSEGVWRTQQPYQDISLKSLQNTYGVMTPLVLGGLVVRGSKQMLTHSNNKTIL